MGCRHWLLEIRSDRMGFQVKHPHRRADLEGDKEAIYSNLRPPVIRGSVPGQLVTLYLPGPFKYNPVIRGERVLINPPRAGRSVNSL